jgi:pSer/pThr/pTyr-binding forkhead associated (FHA) protein
MSRDKLTEPTGPGKTGVFEIEISSDSKVVNVKPRALQVRPTVFAVRKVREVYADMITVGRTPNNDVVIKDVYISKFHAFFRVTPRRVELADAGSRGGTWIGEQRLPPRGAASVVEVKAVVVFGHLEFLFLDAASLWDRLQPGVVR